MIVFESKLAKKYATAFLNVFGQECNDAYIETLKTLSHVITTDRLFQAVLNIPALTTKEKMDIIEHVATKLTLPASTKKLIILLLKDKRIDILDQTIKKIIQLYREKQDKRHFVITTSHELETEERKKVSTFVQNLVNKSISVSFTVDTSLISGIRIKGNNMLWERSIAKQLKDIEQTILGKKS